MSKTRQKSRNELEHLRGENRKLKGENRRLKKQVNELKRQNTFYGDVVEDVVEEINLTNVCENCGKGSIQELDFVYVTILKCDTCDYKETKPKKST